jgi:CBS domain-containing protein
MTYAADLPTLRLTTLRTLTRHGASIAVVPVSTPLTDLVELLGDPQVWVCAVDDAGTLMGVLSREGALRALKRDPGGWVADHMTRSSVSLHAETDISEACATVEAKGADHVLVVTAQGHLLGVVQAAVLATYSHAA